MESHLLIRINVSSVESVNLSVHTMRLPEERPCKKACGVNAITSDKLGRAYDADKCVSCGMCMVSCPFGAISDKSQIFQLARALSRRRRDCG